MVGKYRAPRMPWSMRLNREQLAEAGLEDSIMESADHPYFYASSWPYTHGVQTMGERHVYHVPHLNPNSVMIVVISNDYQEGVWWRLQNLQRYTEDQGYAVAFEEVDDMSVMPQDAIGIMRAMAAMLALDGGFEWCFMVDTDALLEEDTLVRLLSHDRPVVFPLVKNPEDEFLGGGPLNAPYQDPDTGLQPALWSTMVAMLFNTRVFNCLSDAAWRGHDFHFAQMLAHYGHRIYVDTDAKMNCTRGPSRHPAQTWNTLWKRLESKFNSRRNDKRNRKPPPGFDPAFGEGVVDEDGVYWARDEWQYEGVNGPGRRRKAYGHEFKDTDYPPYVSIELRGSDG